MIRQRQFSSAENKKIVRVRDALGRLRANRTDAVAVMALYETCGRELQEVAFRYFAKDQLGKKAVLNLLVAVVSRAWSYDPQSTNASEWVSRVADAEARSLREALDVDGNKGRRTRRAM
jgi:hypothetical protein